MQISLASRSFPLSVCLAREELESGRWCVNPLTRIRDFGKAIVQFSYKEIESGARMIGVIE